MDIFVYCVCQGGEMGKGDKWTVKQIESLLRQVNKLGRRPQEVKIPGRSSRAIDHKLSELRKAGLVTIYFARPWSDEENELLLAQLNKGKTLDKIRISGRTEQAIYAQIKDLRNAGVEFTFKRRLRPQQVRAAAHRKVVRARKRAYKRKLKELRSLLDGEGRNWPSEVIAERLSCKQDFVGRWRKRWGLELNFEEAKNDPVFMTHHRQQVAKRLKAKQCKLRQELIRAKFVRGHLEQRFHTLSRQCTPSQTAKCAKCGMLWYCTKEFFPHLASGNGQVFALRTICSACLS